MTHLEPLNIGALRLVVTPQVHAVEPAGEIVRRFRDSAIAAAVE